MEKAKNARPEDIVLPETKIRHSAEAEEIFGFEEWGLTGKWLKLTTIDGKTVEGAYYQAGKSNGEVIIFHPGLPGDTVGRFEEEFVGVLLEQGYDVFVARHNGLIIQDGNENLFHNKSRIDKDGDISGESLDWFSEPEVSVSYFAQQEKPITLITHSFSGTAGASSFVEMAKEGVESSPAQKIKRWILASAPIWGMKDEDVLDPDRGLSVEDLRSVCRYFATKYVMPAEGGSDKFADRTIEVLRSIDSQIGASIPENTEIVGIYPESDKLVSPQVGVDFFSKLPRGVLLRDKSVSEDKSYDGHDFKQARVEDLLRIMQMQISKSKHTFNINNK